MKILTQWNFFLILNTNVLDFKIQCHRTKGVVVPFIDSLSLLVRVIPLITHNILTTSSYSTSSGSESRKFTHKELNRSISFSFLNLTYTNILLRTCSINFKIWYLQVPIYLMMLMNKKKPNYKSTCTCIFPPYLNRHIRLIWDTIKVDPNYKVLSPFLTSQDISIISLNHAICRSGLPKIGLNAWQNTYILKDKFYVILGQTGDPPPPKL